MTTYNTVEFNHWFSGCAKYEGRGTAQFAEPVGTAFGSAVVTFDVQGRGTVVLRNIEFQTETLPKFGFAEFFYPEGRRGDAFGMSFRNSKRCEALEVQTSDGLLSVHEPIHYSYDVTRAASGDTLNALTFTFASATFKLRGEESALYWAIPLLNFSADFPDVYEGLFEHPLRMWRPASVPDELGAKDAEIFQVLGKAACRMIGFNFEGTAAIIEPVPEYKEILEKLADGEYKWAITSIMSGYLNTHSSSHDTLQNWHPMGLSPLLNLIAGREVGSPWIEWRAGDGRLVGRYHQSFRCPPFREGLAAFQIVSIYGAGYLLTEAQKFNELREGWVAAVVRNLLRGVTTDFLELRAVHVFLAIETLTERYGLGTQRLMDSLAPPTRDKVRQILRATAASIRALASKPPMSDDDRFLPKIADKAVNSGNKDRDFGLAAIDLFRQFGFDSDIAIAETYHAGFTGGSRPWAGALSRWRGVALHGRSFDLGSVDDERELVLETLFHLHDLAVRILLKLCGYTGMYQPATSIETSPQPLDWVGPNTPPERLGYAPGYRLL